MCSSDLVAAQFGLDQVAAAYDLFSKGGKCGKIVLTSSG